ncbi:Oidioi.mRNA.OKI2018_I69.chr1.g2574.t1.cds [Oikopleura dioica]|uniref:Oidioi.mRNA.OKI2018_I69.chr1.g2574.t1.cds n=1 Tax=Oikopleura dioica TaxID=34765 RepID=A0ABN7SUZ9_OIKDI|nr:Oidioi.mRNA.OKI2018_I69.chr1.g2574.t1.cds [Oikopleura dioica]
MTKFQVISFSVRVAKQYGFFVTITGTSDNRRELMKLKKFFKKEELDNALPDLIAGEIGVCIIGKRTQTEFDIRNNLTFYDFVLDNMDWTSYSD